MKKQVTVFLLVFILALSFVPAANASAPSVRVQEAETRAGSCSSWTETDTIPSSGLFLIGYRSENKVYFLTNQNNTYGGIDAYAVDYTGTVINVDEASIPDTVNIKWSAFPNSEGDISIWSEDNINCLCIDRSSGGLMVYPDYNGEYVSYGWMYYPSAFGLMIAYEYDSYCYCFFDIKCDTNGTDGVFYADCELDPASFGSSGIKIYVPCSLSSFNGCEAHYRTREPDDEKANLTFLYTVFFNKGYYWYAGHTGYVLGTDYQGYDPTASDAVQIESLWVTITHQGGSLTHYVQNIFGCTGSESFQFRIVVKSVPTKDTVISITPHMQCADTVVDGAETAASYNTVNAEA